MNELSRRISMRAALATVVASLTLLVGCAQPTPPPPLSPAPEILAFSAAPATVKPGETVTLTWETRNAEKVEIRQSDRGVISGAEGPSGSVQVTVDANALFLLTATNDRGVRANDSVLVKVDAGASDVLFVAHPEVVSSGEEVVLAWYAPGAREVTLAPEGGAAIDLGGQRETGSVAVTPATSTKYVLTVDGKAQQTTVRLRPSIEVLMASPASAVPGQPLVISWKVGGASKLSLSLAGRGPLATVTDPGQVADGSFAYAVPEDTDPAAVFTFILSADGADGSLTARQSLEVYVSGTPRLEAWSIPTYAQEGGTFEITWKTREADVLEILENGNRFWVAPSLAEVANGSLKVQTRTKDTAFQIRARNTRGGEALSDVKTVNPVGIPTLAPGDFTATPQPGIANGGDPVTLTWNVPNARNVKVVANNRLTVHTDSGRSVENDSVVVYPNENTTYTLTADNGLGLSIPPATVTVTVGAPAQLVFDPPSVPLGAKVNIMGSTASMTGAMRVMIPVPNLPTNAFVDIASPQNNTHYTWSDAFADLYTLPTTFRGTLNGSPVSSNTISVHVNGWFSFRSSAFDGPNGPDGTSTAGLPELSVSPLFDDLKIGSGLIYAAVDEVNGEQRLIVQWDNIQHAVRSNTSLTFQAQVYASGRVVFAYKTLQGVSGTTPVIGLVDGSASGIVARYANVPASGETVGIFEKVTPPIEVTAQAGPYVVWQDVGNSFIEISSSVQIIPPGQFHISEVNYNPAAGAEQWFEVQNNTASDVDLTGWYLDFGDGAQVPLDPAVGTTILPAHGRLLFGQTANSAEGIPVNYAYGTNRVMATASGYVGIGLFGGLYAKSSWTSAGTAGVATRFDPMPAELRLAAGESLSCSGSGSYGALGQTGTPGAAHPRCFPWTMRSIPGAFQPIAATGTPIWKSTSLGAFDDVTVSLDFTALGGRSFRMGDKVVGDATTKLSVCSNGWVARGTTNSTAYSNTTTPSTSTPNDVFAVLWDDLEGNAAPSGVYWQQFDPDNTPGSGDEYTLISWENWRHNDPTTASLNFQLKIEEATGSVEYHYGSLSASSPEYANGGTATVWLESPDGKAALTAGANQPGFLQPNSGYRFDFIP